MSWLARLFRPRVELPPEIAARLEAWQRRPAVSERTEHDRLRFVVVDVETTGLDPRRDRLLAIGACAVAGERLVPGQGFEVLLRNEAGSTRENILVHGIGPTAQAEGESPEHALMAFLEFVGKDPVVAFHAGFDRAVLERALRETLGVRLPNPFIDIALLAPALVPEAGLGYAALDDWLGHFGLRAHVRHRAVYDALASGELFLVLLARARARGEGSLGALRALGDPRAQFFPGNGVGRA